MFHHPKKEKHMDVKATGGENESYNNADAASRYINYSVTVGFK